MKSWLPIVVGLVILLSGCAGSGASSVSTASSVSIDAGNIVPLSPLTPAVTPQTTPLSPLGPSIPPKWQPLGPAGIQTSGTRFTGPFSGRVAVAAADPADPDVVYVAAENSGIWKTTNFTSNPPTWVPLTDDLPSMSIGCRCLALAPSNPSIVYAAAAAPNGGILVSTDAGASFTVRATTLFADATFGGIAVHPSDPNLLYVAVQGGSASEGGGVYRSTDGGQTWSNCTRAAHPYGYASDVIIDAQQPSILYAGFIEDGKTGTNGVYKSINGGATWERMGGGVPQGAAVGAYVVVALAPSNDNVLYALVFDPATTGEQEPSITRWRTDDARQSSPTWVQEASVSDPEDYRTNHQTLAIDPANPMHVYGNGDDGPFVESYDGGAKWTKGIGEDPAGVTFNGRGDAILFGDRGVYLLPVGGSFLAPLRKQGNLENALLYQLALAPGSFTSGFAIAQDQLNFLRYGGSLTAWNYCGYGQEIGHIIYDPVHAGVLYAFTGESPPISVLKSTDGGTTFASAENGIDTTVYGTDPKTPIAANILDHSAFDMDPTNPSRLVLGTFNVYETVNGAASWQSISPNPLGGSGAFVQALTIAPSQPQTIYAATSDGQVFVRRQGTTTWTSIGGGLPKNITAPSGQTAVSTMHLRVDPKNAQHVYAVLAVASGGLTNPFLYETVNGGQTWSNAAPSFPALRIYDVAIDWTRKPLAMYAATPRGVYATFDGAATWIKYGQGLPNTVVRSVVLRDGRLVAASYGRGGWWTTAP